MSDNSQGTTGFAQLIPTRREDFQEDPPTREATEDSSEQAPRAGSVTDATPTLLSDAAPEVLSDALPAAVPSAVSGGEAGAIVSGVVSGEQAVASTVSSVAGVPGAVVSQGVEAAGSIVNVTEAGISAVSSVPSEASPALVEGAQGISDQTARDVAEDQEHTDTKDTELKDTELKDTELEDTELEDTEPDGSGREDVVGADPGDDPVSSAGNYPVELNAEGQDAFEQHRVSWPAVSDPSGVWSAADFVGEQAATMVQSGDSLAIEVQPGVEQVDDQEIHEETDATTSQSGEAALAEQATSVELGASHEGASIGAAGVVAGQALALAGAEDQQRAPNQYAYYGEEGFFGERRAEELPQDHQSVLSRWAAWLQAQPDLFPARAMAPKGEPRYLLARHVDSEGLDRTFVYSNLGPGVIAKFLPSRSWPGWEHAADPVVTAALLGNEDLIHGARRHFEQQRDLFSAHSLSYSLAGVALTYRVEESTRRAIADCNSHLVGEASVEAPFVVEATGPIVEPEGGVAHPLQFVAPELFKQIQELLSGPWAAETRSRALGWIRDMIQGSYAENRQAFGQISHEISTQAMVSREAFEAARVEGEDLTAQAWRNLQSVWALPEKERNSNALFPYVVCHRVIVVLSALERWGRAQVTHDPSFVYDLAYLALRAKEYEGQIDLPQRMSQSLPDPQGSFWRSR